MNRLIVINKCDDCPFFDYHYYEYREVCEKLDRKIKRLRGYDIFPIPEDCPLEKTDKQLSEHDE
jgi:hypothetical protein